MCFVGASHSGWGLYCFNGVSFELIQPGVKPGAGSLSWGWNQLALEDHTGEWWFATREGVARMWGSYVVFRMPSQPLRYAGRLMKGADSGAFVARRFL